MSTASCANCGAALPPGAAYCPQCGNRVEAGDTAVLPIPPAETGPVPVETSHVHLFGVTPTMTAFALAVAALAVSVLLLVLGYLLAGLLVLAAAALLALLFVAGSLRKPGGTAGRARETARAGMTSLSVRASARREHGRLLREREELRTRRERLVRSLGDAVYRGDEQATQALRAELDELDRVAADKEAHMEAVAVQARERIDQARFEVQPTEMVEIPEPGPDLVPEPGPAVVPEPTPQPSPEPMPSPGPGIPEPGPTPVPEPTPVPSPQPGPVPVPEPGPVPSPQPGPTPVPEPTLVPSPPAQAPQGGADGPDAPERA
jgi:membrane protein implicated in regulation of membrane protease activity